MRVEKHPYTDELSIVLNDNSTEILHSLLEFISRNDEGIKDRVDGEEIALARVLSDELEYYLLHKESDSTVTNQINDVYNKTTELYDQYQRGLKARGVKF